MTRSIYRFLPLIFVVIFLAAFSMADAEGDSASYSLRQFDQHAIKQYSAQRDFVYDSTPPEQMSIWSWILYQIERLFYKLFSPRQQMTVGKGIMYALMIFGIVMLVLNLAGIEVRKFLVRDAQAIIPHQVGEENIREMNMDELIADAASKKQWRLSVRYQYLKALRLLTDRELIRWQAGKTNMDYYYELRADELRNPFLMATDDFENAWYGNGEVTEEHFRESKKSLEGFYAQIQNYRA